MRQMLDHHVDERDLRCRRRAAREEVAEGLVDRRAVEPDERANETAEALARLAGALDVALFSDTRVEQHVFELGEVGRRQRSALPQLVKHDVIFMGFEEMPRLLLEADEVGL